MNFSCCDTKSVLEALEKIVELRKEYDMYNVYISDYNAMRKFNYSPIIHINKDDFQLLDENFNCEGFTKNLKEVAEIIVANIRK